MADYTLSNNLACILMPDIKSARIDMNKSNFYTKDFVEQLKENNIKATHLAVFENSIIFFYI